MGLVGVGMGMEYEISGGDRTEEESAGGANWNRGFISLVLGRNPGQWKFPGICEVIKSQSNVGYGT